LVLGFGLAEARTPTPSAAGEGQTWRWMPVRMGTIYVLGDKGKLVMSIEHIITVAVSISDRGRYEDDEAFA
jgi:hypothetical protein